MKKIFLLFLIVVFIVIFFWVARGFVTLYRDGKIDLTREVAVIENTNINSVQTLEELIQDYAAGNIDELKYLELLQEHAEKAGKKINYNRAKRELLDYILYLKTALPYSEYQEIVKISSKHPDISEELYSYLLNLSRERDMDLSRYPELTKFFTYFELKQKIDNRQEEIRNSDDEQPEDEPETEN
jgi:hypothetical protein